MKRFTFFFITLVLTKIVFADPITVHNHTNDSLFMRIYYQENTDAIGQGTGSIAQVLPRHSITMNRPPRKLERLIPPKWYDRNLFVAHQATLLSDSVHAYTLKTLAHINVGDLQGSVFHFARKDGVIHGYTDSEWKIIQPTLQGLQSLAQQVDHYTIEQLKDYIKKNYAAVVNNPHKYDKAYVQSNNAISPAEQDYIKKRMPHIQKALENLLDMSLENHYIPKIACVFSGGGHRAMISTIGSLIACQQIGLMPATLWNVGLSGSTWALASWLVSGSPIQMFSQQLFAAIGQHITQITSSEAQLIIDSLVVKWAYNQPLTLVDIYGALLANRLLWYKGQERQRVYLSEQIKNIGQHDMPLAIFTAIQTGTNDPMPRWYEFSCYHIGSPELGMYVEPWAFGRKFSQGVSRDYAPEQTLGFLLGTFGSAFAAPYEQIYEQLQAGTQDPVSKKVLSLIADSLVALHGEIIGKKRAYHSWAEVYNFTMSMPTSLISNQPTIRLSDAGINFNLPYPPVSGENPERSADIILLFDYSGGIHSASALRGIEQYTQSNHLAFPTINYTNITKQALTIFHDPQNSQAPLIIYLPLIKDQNMWNKYRNDPHFKQYSALLDNFDPVKCTDTSFCATTNFQYDQQQAQQLAAHTTFTLLACKEQVVAAIKTYIQQKSIPRS